LFAEQQNAEALRQQEAFASTGAACARGHDSDSQAAGDSG
jgi:hypothetical protein